MAFNFITEIANKIKKYGELTMFSHTIFSLPFGILAMLYAANGIPRFRVFFWIFIALVSARNGANCFNRIADRKIDARNARTSDRHLVTGKISYKESVVLCIFCFTLMAVSAYMLNTLCLILLPLAIFGFVFYSYSKRFTWLCHFILGICCGGAPVGAWIAVTNGVTAIHIPIILGAAVCFWVSGFDIIYATQDIDFDRNNNIFAIPAKFGLNKSIYISRISHCIAVFLLILFGVLIGSGYIYYIGILAIVALLLIEHRNIVPNSKKKMIFASYKINQIISLVFFVFGVLDFIIK